MTFILPKRSQAKVERQNAPHLFGTRPCRYCYTFLTAAALLLELPCAAPAAGALAWPRQLARRRGHCPLSFCAPAHREGASAVPRVGRRDCAWCASGHRRQNVARGPWSEGGAASGMATAARGVGDIVAEGAGGRLRTERNAQQLCAASRLPRHLRPWCRDRREHDRLRALQDAVFVPGCGTCTHALGVNTLHIDQVSNFDSLNRRHPEYPLITAPGPGVPPPSNGLPIDLREYD